MDFSLAPWQSILKQWRKTMTDKYKNKYRIESARLQTWDYGWNAAYFVTICAADRKHYFGEIDNGKMVLSKIGIITQREWTRTSEIRPDMNLILDGYIVMPNHFHAIIIIGENKYNERTNAMQRGRDAMHIDTKRTDTKRTDAKRTDAMHCVSTDIQNQFAAQRKNLSSIIRGYKSAITTFARKNNINFAWQPRFHDRIIRNDDEFGRIRNYILNNSLNWDNDKYYN